MMLERSRSYLNADDVGVRCRCGLVFKVAEFTNGLCPECRLAEILVKDDMASPDRAKLTFSGPEPPIF